MPDTSSTIPVSDITTRPLHWLWPRRIPFSHLTILYGHTGSGLSLLALHLAACVSSGRSLPDDQPCPQGNVILITPLDTPSHTIKPRLEHAAADTSHVFLLNNVTLSSPTTPPVPTFTSAFNPEPYQHSLAYSNPSFSAPSLPGSSFSPLPFTPPSLNTLNTPTSHTTPTGKHTFSLARDLAHLEQAIQQHSARLIIIDSPEVSRDQIMRPIIRRLSRIACDTDSAILLIRSLSRPLVTPLSPASIRTLPLISSVHSALLVIPDPDPIDDRQERLLLSVKHTFSTPTPVLSCAISLQPSGIPTVQWFGEHSTPVIASTHPHHAESTHAILHGLILDTLQNAPEPVSLPQLNDTMPFTHDNIRKTLQRMRQNGEIISPARGMYTLPSSSKNNDVPAVPIVPNNPN